VTESELRELIRGIVAEVLAAQAPRSEAPRPNAQDSRPNALVLFSGALLGFDTAVESLKRLVGDVNLNWTQTPSAERILDQAKIAEIGMVHASESLVQAHDMLILPNATVNLIAKVTHGVGDCLASNVLAEFLMSNRPVVVAVNAACPDSADKRGWFPEMPAGYQEMLRANLATLKSFGARLTTTERLDHAVRTVRRPTEQLRPPATAAVASVPAASARPADACADWVGDYPDETMAHPPVGCAARVVDESLIRGTAPGSVLCVGRAALITPLAREAAAARGITIEKVG